MFPNIDLIVQTFVSYCTHLMLKQTLPARVEGTILKVCLNMVLLYNNCV